MSHDDLSPEEQDRRDEALTEADRLLSRAYAGLAGAVGRAEARTLLYALAKGLPQSRRRGPVDPERDAKLLAAYERAPAGHKEESIEPIAQHYSITKTSALRVVRGLRKQWREGRLPFATVLHLPAVMLRAVPPKPEN